MVPLVGLILLLRAVELPAGLAAFTAKVAAIALAFVAVFTVSAVLMSFEEVREVGRSLLASVGIAAS